MRLVRPLLIVLLLTSACAGNFTDKRSPDACGGSPQCHDLPDHVRGGGNGGMGGGMGHGMQ